MKKHKHFSRIMVTHFIKFGLRSSSFLTCLIIYIFQKINNPSFNIYENKPLLLAFGISWLIILIDMMLRLFPSKIESKGCQKIFKRNYMPNVSNNENIKQNNMPIILIAISWIGLNGIIAALYYLGIIDKSLLLIIGLAYSVCDLICILFFCPFQTWYMKNKCCTTCRIYNWDYFMMCTPLIFVINFLDMQIYDYLILIVLLVSIIILIKWEVVHKLHPERFVEETNVNLKCTNCKEKLCTHKKQLRSFLKKYKHLLK